MIKINVKYMSHIVEHCNLNCILKSFHYDLASPVQHISDTGNETVDVYCSSMMLVEW